MSAPRSTHSEGSLRVVLTVLAVVALSLATPGAAASTGLDHDRVPGRGVHGHLATMTDLGTLGEGPSEGNAVNDRGQVIGDAYTAGGYLHAFRWTASGGMQDLGALGGRFSVASAINARGQVTGWANPAGRVAYRAAFRWTASGGMQDLGTLGGTNSYVSYRSAINDRGQVTGSAQTADGATHAFLWTP